MVQVSPIKNNQRRVAQVKKIKIRNFHKIPILAKVFLGLAIPILLLLLVIWITEGIGVLIVVSAIPFAMLLVGGIFFLNYGITISAKNIFLIDQVMLRKYKMEDVDYIKIVFKNDGIGGEVKKKGGKVYPFSFSGLNLSCGLSSYPKKLWRADLKITKKFVTESIANLSTCKKVKIQNFYTKES